MRHQLIFAMGLPGSGKSTLLRNIEQSFKAVKFIDIDEIHDEQKDFCTKSTLSQILDNYLKNNQFTYLIVDGLFLTVHDAKMLIKEVRKRVPIDGITIYHFNLDRETCLLNDVGRREDNCVTTIKKSTYAESV